MTVTIPNILRILLPILLLALQACSHAVKPDLERLYEQSRNVNQPPVILIHGLMGSRLSEVDSGEEVWVGNVSKLLFSSYEDLALEIDPQTLRPRASKLVASGLLDKVAGTDFYADITHTLETAGRFQRKEPGRPQGKNARNYYVFTYDWRQDNVQSARKLSKFIEQIRLDYADPSLKVDLIAHSMGGLIARYYLRYGETDTLDDNDFTVNLHGSSRVRRTILLGTPNLGSASALHSFIDGYKLAFGTIPTETLVTMPGPYQLFPHALSD
jgi:hypothetical protein